MDNELITEHAARLNYCACMKKDYYTKCIKMLYNWPYMNENEIDEHVKALGLFDYRTAIIWLITHKSTLNVEINISLGELFKANGYELYHAILDRLKVALVVCNKTQAINILSAIALHDNEFKHAIDYLDTF